MRVLLLSGQKQKEAEIDKETRKLCTTWIEIASGNQESREADLEHGGEGELERKVDEDVLLLGLHHHVAVLSHLSHKRVHAWHVRSVLFILVLLNKRNETRCQGKTKTCQQYEKTAFESYLDGSQEVVHGNECPTAAHARTAVHEQRARGVWKRAPHSLVEQQQVCKSNTLAHVLEMMSGLHM